VGYQWVMTAILSTFYPSKVGEIPINVYSVIITFLWYADFAHGVQILHSAFVLILLVISLLNIIRYARYSYWKNVPHAGRNFHILQVIDCI
jgi:hypothetical protein